MKDHWNTIYTQSSEEKLGWHETDLTPTLYLLEKAELLKEARVLIAGAGSTTLVDELLRQSYTNILAIDISEAALNKLQGRIGKESDNVQFIVDDLTNPVMLSEIGLVDLWIDRAVLHFFTEQTDQVAYFNLIRSGIKKGGFTLLAEYNQEGAIKCAGLPVQRYSVEMLQENLGGEFILIDSFNHIFTMPSGDIRPYIYTLFKKQ